MTEMRNRLARAARLCDRPQLVGAAACRGMHVARRREIQRVAPDRVAAVAELADLVVHAIPRRQFTAILEQSVAVWGDAERNRPQKAVALARGVRGRAHGP